MEVEAVSISRPPDQFCKREGRRNAVNKVLKTLKACGYSKVERWMVFNAVCPEYVRG